MCSENIMVGRELGMAGRGPRKPEKRPLWRIPEERIVKDNQAEGTAWAEAQRRAEQNWSLRRGREGPLDWTFKVF